MKGLALLNHSLRMLTGNFDAALRISLVLFAAMQVSIYALDWVVLGDPLADRTSRGWTFGIVYMIVTTPIPWTFGSWIAVRWHRFVLLEEHPTGVVPEWDGRLVLSYAWRTLKIVLTILAFLLGVVAVAFVVASGPVLIALDAPLLAHFMSFALVLLSVTAVLYVALRISLGLPAVALGSDLTIAGSWAASARVRGEIAVLALTACTIDFAARFLIDAISSAPALTLASWLVLEWITMMVTVAVLTTLYGHLIEGRRL